MTAALATPAPEREVVHATLAACSIARLALPLVPADEPRPRRAIEAAEAWAAAPSERRARKALGAAADAYRADGCATAARRRAVGAAAHAAALAGVAPDVFAGSRALLPLLVSVAEAWPSAQAQWPPIWVRDALLDELSLCADAILAAHAHPHPRPTPLDAFLVAPSRDGALVALDWLREGRGTASPPVWALAWLYAHVPGVAP